MAQEDHLRESLPAEAFAARRGEMMLAIGEEAGRFLNLLIKAAGAKNLLEIGTSVGYSTLWLADAARVTHGRVITLDINPGKHTQARENLAEAGLLNRVELITGDAAESIDRLAGPWDFVLLDTLKADYIPCFEAFHPKLAAGALIAADNMVFPESQHTRAYQQRVRGSPGYQSVMVPIGNGIELSRKQT